MLKKKHIYCCTYINKVTLVTKRCLTKMEKDSKLLGSDKIWVFSPQFAYIYYTQFILCKTNLKECHGLVCSM